MDEMTLISIMSESDLERFWSKVTLYGENDCWNWTASKLPFGYGQFGLGGRKGQKSCRAHRISYALANGIFDRKLKVLHECDNPSCVNPKHLFLGSQLDNMRDMFSKGRGRPARLPGAKNGSAKLTQKQVDEIRNTTGKVRDIAIQYGIGKSQVSNIRRGASWA
jgi:HNH endonuclease